MKSVIFLFFVLLSCNLTFAQQDSLVVHYDESKLQIQEITEEDLSDYKNNDDFIYVETTKDDSIINKIRQWLTNIFFRIFEAIFGIRPAKGILGFIFNVLPYIVLGILVFLLIKFFLKVNSKNIVLGKQKKPTVAFSDDEHIIKNEDIKALINKAIDNGNYRLAVRYSYLLVLKELTEKEIIKWELQKTNEDYIKEIKNQELQSRFTNITRIYDYVWYGEFTIDALKFKLLKPVFDTITNSTLKH